MTCHCEYCVVFVVQLWLVSLLTERTLNPTMSAAPKHDAPLRSLHTVLLLPIWFVSASSSPTF